MTCEKHRLKIRNGVLRYFVHYRCVRCGLVYVVSRYDMRLLVQGSKLIGKVVYLEFQSDERYEQGYRKFLKGAAP